MIKDKEKQKQYHWVTVAEFIQHYKLIHAKDFPSMKVK